MPAATLYDALYDALEDERPLDLDSPADRALYVEGLHKVDGINPADELLRQIQLARDGGAWFFTGHRGVGKSTELLRIAHELRQEGHFVVVADMGLRLNLAEEVSIELLLLTAMAALSEEFEKTFGGQPLARGYARRIAEYLTRTNVQLSTLSLGLSAGNVQSDLTLLLKDDPTFRERVVAAARGSLGTFVGEVRGYVKEVLAHVAAHRPNKKVVLILDSLEKLRVSGVDAAQRYDAIQKTFEVHADHLKYEGMSVVYSIPPYLPYLAPRIGAYFGVSVCSLPHVKVFERPGPAVARDATHPAGIAFMVDSLERRCSGSEKVIVKPHLERLARASSGSLRDFFRLVKVVCTKAPLANEPTPMANPRWIDAAEHELRAEMPLAGEDIAWLKVVRATQGTGLDKIDNLPKLARLFDSGVILSYRNSQDWCDVHYLLRKQVDEAPEVPNAPGNLRLG
jgi:hypothetical protein